MTDVVLVDWLGRGGIAQCTEAWAIELDRAGISVTVVTRPERELGSGVVLATAPEAHANRIVAHRAVATTASRVIRDLRPDVVIIQNYVIPALEMVVDRASKAVGATVVRVVHDHRPHSRWAASRAGLRGLLRRCDVVLAHTHFVAEAAAAYAGRPVRVLPHPVQVGMLAAQRRPSPVPPATGALAVHFGVLHRSYKGTERVVELAREGVVGWRFAMLGAGAPAIDGLVGVARFLEPGALVAAVEASDATLLPYRWATQSGAVVLAQALGSIPIVTDVGGLSEQVLDGVTGCVLAHDAPTQQWRSTLERLRPPSERRLLADAAREAVWAQHERFVRDAIELVGHGR